MKKVVVKCMHCEATGFCKRGDADGSCNFCQFAAGHKVATSGRMVRCSICHGTGSVIQDKPG